MRVHYIEGTLEEIIENKRSYSVDNLYVRIGEKIKLGLALCEVVEIVHYPDEVGEYRVDVFVKVIKKLPDTFWDRNILDIFLKK
ncbi:hypothetical protein [Paenibacillus macquariensis]|uniref:Uncharacterized protein n=1 Tax=Paenibacillus macquariensis TaxID=948756 RepID=A0ABY1JW90_9BACL|nr:hypothetical protein [Paenibacillus macquariensis]MEC0094358.1 hypothetical protein [Paenibacillus macquariensis]OAB34393.1 hypothetical protein PMSM_10975 [Paenibacillus macquariensis subsp. macquariensis]SIQ87531.1 hypothetical protein SAMN05421578_104440 [Paenibacillus macquariensis]